MKLAPAFEILEEIESPSSVQSMVSATFPPRIGELAEELGEDAEEQHKSASEGGCDTDNAAAMESLQRELELVQKMAEAELEENREKWCVKISGELADQLSGALTQLQEDLRRETAAALLPLVSEKIREKAIAELVDQIRRLIEAGSCARIKISGPACLISRAQEFFVDTKMVEFLETPDAIELAATFDTTVIKTCISEWMDRLEEAIS